MDATPFFYFIMHEFIAIIFGDPAIPTERSPLVGEVSASVVRVPGYRSGGPGSISGATRFSE
jgi:hypothetical protein